MGRLPQVDARSPATCMEALPASWNLGTPKGLAGTPDPGGWPYLVLVSWTEACVAHQAWNTEAG